MTKCVEAAITEVVGVGGAVLRQELAQILYNNIRVIVGLEKPELKMKCDIVMQCTHQSHVSACSRIMCSHPALD